MVFAVIAIASMIAGIIQSVTGFGSAVFLMLIVPFFFDMVTAAAVSSSIAMGLGIALAWQFRSHIEWKLCALPTAIYMISSVSVISIVQDIDLDTLTLTFGIFLILLAAYFFVFADRVSFSANWKTGFVCSAISGLTSGLFGIGGPLMAVYFVSASQEKQSYIANIQFLFAATNIVSFLTRISRGIYTPDLLPVTVVGFLGITVGKRIGLQILDRINLNAMKKSVYAFVGLSGLITVLQQVV